MAYLSAETRTRLQAELTTVEAQIASANTTLSELVTLEIESFRLDTGEGSQQAKRVDIEKAERLIRILEIKAERLRQRLAGGGVVALNLRRTDGR